MQLYVTEDYRELSKKAAQVVAEQIQKKPGAIIGFATGGTPMGLYEELIGKYNQGEVDFSGITTFNLDEYVGLTREHPQSYYHFMWENLFSKVNVKKERIHFPPGIFTDAQAVCRQYEAQMDEAGGIDLQILGIGTNGHIGFNEPADTFEISTHLVDLAEETIEANARFFGDKTEVPRKAITMGVGSIMKAKSILLLASGKNKAEAVSHIYSGFVDPRVPASVLQLHPHVTLVIDKEAAQLIEEKGASTWLHSQ
ncbi:glucosamine-6-phosphate deaminase [Brevibacillus migulae]|uniref:glucosamine-6-phosphate deaminase n=1 Tax=Brevibacillus migulae TaxID=1644114 RepID=UPI00106DDB0C|nr:glucosamine-6-phosphate deaminase [Brevibacillus migulae]